MQLNITARHLDLTPAISDYVHRKVEKAERYCDSIIWAQVILAVEKHRQIAEIVVHTPGSTFRTVGESFDLYSAVDLAAHKLDLHLSKLKDKQRGHRGKNNSKNMELEGPSIPPPQTLPNSITEYKKISLEVLSLTQAAKMLLRNTFAFLPFVNERTNRICVIYKKKQGEYGLLESEEQS